MKILEIIRGEDGPAYGFDTDSSQDIVHFVDDDYKPGILNFFKQTNNKTIIVKRPHKYKVDQDEN